MDVQISEGIGSILIIEDEGLVSMMIEDMARQMGVAEIIVCADLETALAAAANADLDCAVLDVRVRGGDTAPVADLLARHNVPFLFSTGGNVDYLPERHRHRPIINKPFSEDDFTTALLDAWRGARGIPCGPAERVATPTLTD